jgi:hypothetical protein
MPLSLNEIKDRALAFSHEWAGAKAERAEAQTFWNEFFNVFGISRRRVASFEEPVRRAHSQFEKKGGGGGFIDSKLGTKGRRSRPACCATAPSDCMERRICRRLWLALRHVKGGHATAGRSGLLSVLREIGFCSMSLEKNRV